MFCLRAHKTLATALKKLRFYYFRNEIHNSITCWKVLDKKMNFITKIMNFITFGLWVIGWEKVTGYTSNLRSKFLGWPLEKLFGKITNFNESLLTFGSKFSIKFWKLNGKAWKFPAKNYRKSSIESFRQTLWIPLNFQIDDDWNSAWKTCQNPSSPPKDIPQEKQSIRQNFAWEK
jgi:hypothetical protein